jgi:hypothetical protein
VSASLGGHRGKHRGLKHFGLLFIPASRGHNQRGDTERISMRHTTLEETPKQVPWIFLSYRHSNGGHWMAARISSELETGFSVVRFRSDFVLASEEHPMKVHTHPWLLTPLSPPHIPWGATHQGTPHGVWGADAFAGPYQGTTRNDRRLQPLENTALSRGIIGKSALILAVITIRKSQ